MYVSSNILNVHLMIFHALYPCLHYNAENAERTKRNTKHVSARQEKMYMHYVRSFKLLKKSLFLNRDTFASFYTVNIKRNKKVSFNLLLALYDFEQ